MNDSTRPLPTVTMQAVDGESETAPRVRLSRHPVAIAVTFAAGIIAASIVVVSWRAILITLVSAAAIALLALVVAFVLFRISTGGGPGPFVAQTFSRGRVARRRR